MSQVMVLPSCQNEHSSEGD